MRKYEMLCILKAGFDIENTDKIIANIETAIKDFDGKINNVNKLGRKKLAFEITKIKDGFYAIFDIEMAADKMVELKRYLKLNDSVIREFITVKTGKFRATSKKSKSK